MMGSPTGMRWLAALLVTAALLVPAIGARAQSLGFDENALRATIEKNINTKLEAYIKGQEETWFKRAGLGDLYKDLTGLQDARAAYTEAVAAGKTRREAYDAALAKLGGLPTVKRVVDSLVSKSSRQIIRDLNGEYTWAKQQLSDLLPKVNAVNDVKDPAELADTLRSIGLTGDGLDRFEAFERRMNGISRTVKERFGTPYQMYKIINEGMTGKELGSGTRAAFTLLEEVGGSVPILGKFVELYAKVAKELLDATLRLRGALDAVDMGCVGTGSYGWFSAMEKAFTFGGTACPEPPIKNLYVDWSDPRKIYYWTGSAWIKAPEKGIGGAATIREIMDYLSYAAARNLGVPVDVPTAFTFYGIPGGFEKARAEALEVFNGVLLGWDRLRREIIAMGVTAERADAELQRRIQGRQDMGQYLRTHFAQNEHLFVHRFLVSLLGDGVMAREFRGYHAGLKALRTMEIAGEVVLAPKMRGLSAEVSLQIPDALRGMVLRERIDQATGTWFLALLGGPGQTFQYTASYGSLAKKDFRISRWIYLAYRHTLQVEPSIDFRFTSVPDMTVGVPGTISGQILPEQGQPPGEFSYTWRAQTAGEGTGQTAGGTFSIPLTFQQAGAKRLIVTAQDPRGFTSRDGVDVNVAFTIDADLQPYDPETGMLPVVVSITGGVGPYEVTWRTNTGVTVTTTPIGSRFFANLPVGDGAGVTSIEITVFDRGSRIQTSAVLSVSGFPPPDPDAPPPPGGTAGDPGGSDPGSGDSGSNDPGGGGSAGAGSTAGGGSGGTSAGGGTAGGGTAGGAPPGDPCKVPDTVASAFVERIAREAANPSKLASAAARLLTADEKSALLNCICRHHSGKTSHVSVWYAPSSFEGECQKPSKGACAWSSFGCGRVPFKPDAEALKACGAGRTMARAICEGRG